MNPRKVRFILLLPLLAALIYPVIVVFTNSFMSPMEINRHYLESSELIILRIIPDFVSIKQYLRILITEESYLHYFWNSVFITSSIILGHMLIASMAAFGFTFYKFRFRDEIFFFYIVTMLMPYQVTLVPNYIVIKKLGLMNSWAAIIIPGIFSCFGVFLLRQFMLNVPKSYIESARIEGATDWRIFLQIVVPIVKGGITALVLLVGVDNWNMVEQPLIFLSDTVLYPLSLILSNISLQEASIGFASSLIFMAPFLLFFLNVEKDLITAITNSGVKG